MCWDVSVYGIPEANLVNRCFERPEKNCRTPRCVFEEIFGIQIVWAGTFTCLFVLAEMNIA